MICMNVGPAGIWCIQWFSAKLPTCSSLHRPPPQYSSTRWSWKSQPLNDNLGRPKIFRSEIVWFEVKQWALWRRSCWKIKFLRLVVAHWRQKENCTGWVFCTAVMRSWSYQLDDQNDNDEGSREKKKIRRTINVLKISTLADLIQLLRWHCWGWHCEENPPKNP